MFISSFVAFISLSVFYKHCCDKTATLLVENINFNETLNGRILAYLKVVVFGEASVLSVDGKDTKLLSIVGVSRAQISRDTVPMSADCNGTVASASTVLSTLHNIPPKGTHRSSVTKQQCPIKVSEVVFTALDSTSRSVCG
ncbi:unnamed protein product [Toxocara canis]|uniref:Recep_L_domain domain-containing protein n=1 Tax=Toxocara canis TaxID=6265 RepID=A0A183U7U3_TOXCA|nr:unnamed protein product [Toxocara canis]